MKYAGSDSQREHGRGGLTSSSQEDLTIDMLRQSKDKEIDKVREALKQEDDFCRPLPTGSQLENHL